MKSHQSQTGTEHVIRVDRPGGPTLTECHLSVDSTSEVETPEDARHVLDNLCGTCRQALTVEQMDELRELASQTELETNSDAPELETVADEIQSRLSAATRGEDPSGSTMIPVSKLREWAEGTRHAVEGREQ